MKTRSLYTLLLMLFVGCSAQAQMLNPTPSTIDVSMTSSELLPADLIVFTININAEERTPRLAFTKHKERETLLAGLLKEMDIAEENIKYQPIRINKMYRNNREDKYSQTNQQVSVTFSDFSLYEELQLTLIENDFDSFNGNFSSTHMEKGKKNALKQAISAAKERAELIANETGVTLGTPFHISYSDYAVRPTMSMEYDATALRSSAAPSMMDFAQTISVTATISIQFSIQN